MTKRCAEDQAKYPNVIPHKIPQDRRRDENIFKVMIPRNGIMKNGQNAIWKCSDKLPPDMQKIAVAKKEHSLVPPSFFIK